MIIINKFNKNFNNLKFLLNLLIIIIFFKTFNNKLIFKKIL